MRSERCGGHYAPSRSKTHFPSIIERETCAPGEKIRPARSSASASSEMPIPLSLLTPHSSRREVGFQTRWSAIAVAPLTPHSSPIAGLVTTCCVT